MIQPYKLWVSTLIFLLFQSYDSLAQDCTESCLAVYNEKGEVVSGTVCQPSFGLKTIENTACLGNEKCLLFDNTFLLNPPETIYYFTWDDGASNTLTHQELLNIPEEVDPISGKFRRYCHSYLEPTCLDPDALFTISVNLLNLNGECTNNIASSQIAILTPIEVDFGMPEFVCLNTPFTIQNTSIEGYNQDCTTDGHYEWDFEDNGTVDIAQDGIQVLTHPGFDTPGVKTIRLTGHQTPEHVCGDDTEVKTITVFNVPEPKFSIGEGSELTTVSDCKTENVFVFNPPENACIDVNLPLENITEYRNTSTTFRWDIIPSSGATFTNEDLTLDNNEITFTEAGTYEVALIVEDNCTDGIININKACIKVIVKGQPNVTIQANSICEGDYFTATILQDEEPINIDDIRNIEWKVEPTGSEIVPTYANGNAELTIEDLPTGTYNISISYTTDCGTYTSVPLAINSYPLPEVTISTISETFCTDTEFTITADETEADTYTWYENGIEINGETEATLIPRPGTPGNYEYFVEISKNDCINTSNTLTLVVNLSPTSNPILVSNELFCSDQTVDFTLEVQNVNPSNATLQWQSCAICDGSDWAANEDVTKAIFTGNAPGNYRVLIESNNCSFATDPVEIRQLGAIDPKISVVEGNTCNAYTLNVENLNDSYTYQWQLDGVDLEGATTPIFAVDAPGEYRVAVTQEECTEITPIENITFDPIPAFDFYFDEGLNAKVQSGENKSAYRIISFPLNLDIKNVLHVFDELGEYYKNNWRLFTVNNQGEFIEYPDFQEIEVGKGYLLIFKNSGIKTINSGKGKTVEANINEPFKIPVHSGWNLIGNPFNFNVPWRTIIDFQNEEATILPNEIREYGANWSTTADTLFRLGGNLVFIHDNISSIKIPVICDDLEEPSGGRVKEEVIVKNQWEIPLSLTSKNDSSKQTMAGFGMHPNANLSRDIHDVMSPPHFGNYMDINFQHPEYFYSSFAKDVVPIQDSHIWEFNVATNVGEEVLTLAWNAKGFPVDGKEIFLMDVGENKVVDMRAKNAYSFINNTLHSFKIFYGTQDFMDANVYPNEVRLQESYPNPFSQQTTIPFTIPKSEKDYHVSMQIYDISGREIITLKDEMVGSGFYEIQWDGTDASGNKMNNGIYICELVAESGEKVIKEEKRLLLVSP